jgi:putative hydrolase of HD superfamily
MTRRLQQQIAFLTEADKLKSVARRTRLIDDSRPENSAEHTWHVLLGALVLREYFAGPFDPVHMLELLVVHDLVEIDAGDTFAYDHSGQGTRLDRERAAADRLYGLLPSDQTAYFRALWDEFEAQQTPEARIANALDRLQPLLQNAASNGGTWRTYGLSREDVLQRMAPLETTLPQVWPSVVAMVEQFCPPRPGAE